MRRLILFSLLVSVVLLLFIRESYTGAFYTGAGQSMVNTFAAASVFPTATLVPTSAGIANHVVIGEVQVQSATSTAHDFIELYNPTNTPYNLNGHRLVKRTGSPSDDTIKSWTSDEFIPAHGYYLWASSSNGYAASIGADTSTADTLAANNSVALRLGAENSGTIIDALSWHSAANALKEGAEFGTNPGAGQSIERKALSTSTVTSMTTGADVGKGNGYDTNNNATDFILRSVSQPQNSSSSTESP